jgi:glycosyltransferase involved in cell wall biosynthesis
MRLFHLVPNMNFGGLQEVVRGLALCQRQAGHAVTIGCWTNETNHPEAEHSLRQAGVEIVYLRRAADGTLLNGKLALFQKVKGHLEAAKPDILHVHNPFGYFLTGAIAARITGIGAIVYTIHATVMFDEVVRKAAGAGWLKIRLNKAEFWIAAMLTDGLVAVCSEAETYIRSRFFLPGKKMWVVENGIDVTPFLAVPARPPRSEIVFGAVGRMSHEKNHRTLIEAFALVCRSHNNVRLRLLGGGPKQQTLKELVRKLEIDSVVEFRGLSHDVAGFLGGLDVFVLPSISEGLPLSLIEAIAAGLPVVATAVGGVPKVVQQTNSGWLCPSQNVEALRAAIESAIDDPNRRDRGEKARALAAKYYSAERMYKDYQERYVELLQ